MSPQHRLFQHAQAQRTQIGAVVVLLAADALSVAHVAFWRLLGVVVGSEAVRERRLAARPIIGDGKTPKQAHVLALSLVSRYNGLQVGQHRFQGIRGR
jgi:hypothetical protein